MILPAIICLSNNCSKNPGFIPSRLPVDPPANDTLVFSDTSIKSFLALGDSYTIGQSVEPEVRYPTLAAQWLNENGAGVKKPVYIAQTGWTTRSLISAMQKIDVKDTFDIITLLIGVNDQFQGFDTGGYSARFTEILEKSIRLAGGRPGRVFVLSIPDYSVTPFVSARDKQEVSESVDLFNTINKRITEEHHCPYINVTESSRDAAFNASLIASDRLHFSGVEYRKWANLLGPVILRSFK